MADIATTAFEPRALQRMIEIRSRPYNWYASRYFGAAQGVHGVRLVELDVLVGGKKMAPIQRPTDRSRLMARDAAASHLIKLPYMKPGRATTAEEIINRRAVGSHLYAERDLVGAAQRQIGRDIEDLDDMIERRKEYMAAQTVQTGITPLVSLDENGVKSISAEVVWGTPAANLVTLTGTDLWTNAASDPLGNLEDWGALIVEGAQASASFATVGYSVGKALRKHAELLKLLDNLEVKAGNLELRAASIDGIRYLGNLGGIEFYEDRRTYVNDQGVSTYYTPPDRLVLGAANAENRWHYGPISDLKCPTPLTERWVKQWEVEEPSQRYVAVHSAPLPGLHVPASIVSAKVV